MRHPLTVLIATGAALVPAIACAATGASPDATPGNVPPPVTLITPVARDTLAIHNPFMVIMTVLVVVAFAIMLYSMIRHRKRSGQAPAQFSGPRGLVQWIWVLVPFAIILVIDFALMGL